MDEEQQQLFLMFALDEFTERSMRFPLRCSMSKTDEDDEDARVAGLATLFDGVVAVMTKHGPLVRDADSPIPGAKGPIFIYRANERGYVEMAVSPRGIVPTLVVDGERHEMPDRALPEIYWCCSSKRVVGPRARMIAKEPYPMWDRSDPKIELIQSLRVMRYGIKKAEDGDPWRRPKEPWQR